MKPLAPAVRKVWMIKFAIFWTVLSLGILIYEIFRIFGEQTAAFPFGTLFFCAVIVGTTVTYFIPRLRYKYWRYDLLPEELYLEHGIFNRIRTIVPLRRIQHLDVSQDLIEREFGLGKLIVHTAGTRSSDVVLPGLLHEEAEMLRDEMKKYLLEETV